MIEVRGQPCRGRSARGRGVMWGPAVLLVLMGWVRSAQSEPASTIILGEAVPKGSCSRVRIEMKAHGLFRPALPPGKVVADARMPKPMALDVQTRLVFSERVLGTGRGRDGDRYGEGGGGGDRDGPARTARQGGART